MTRRTLQGLVGAGGAVVLLALPMPASAKPPEGECPGSFYEKSVHDTPVHFLAAALDIDRNDDLAVCFKPMANGAATNVIDNIAKPR